MDKKTHWETVYKTKTPNQISWTQYVPQPSLDFIESLNLEKNAKIIDVGGGDSKLVDHLLHYGFENVSVLDISAKALERAKERLGEKAEKVTWIVGDISDFKPSETYDLWHDRATFHFLTEAEDIEKYRNMVQNHVLGYLIIGTFSENGPQKCSGLEISQYTEEKLSAVIGEAFQKINCLTIDHKTPFDTYQNFLFCSFRKR